jgi:hypothetical protein
MTDSEKLDLRTTITSHAARGLKRDASLLAYPASLLADKLCKHMQEDKGIDALVWLQEADDDDTEGECVTSLV